MSRDRDNSRDRKEGKSGEPASVFVRNFPLEWRAQEVRDLFEKYGSIKDVYLPRDYYTQRYKGIAFVEFENVEEAEVACSNLDQYEIEDRKLAVNLSKSKRSTRDSMVDREYREGKRGGGGRDRYDRRDDYDRRRGDDRRGGGYERSRRSRSRSGGRRRRPSRDRRSRSRRRSATRSRSRS